MYCQEKHGFLQKKKSNDFSSTGQFSCRVFPTAGGEIRQEIQCVNTFSTLYLLMDCNEIIKKELFV